ncbi:MAG TPA: hypothetical protein VFY75_09560 [Solirubrobacterales bacterium]|nr:hypothetical protein [Solirubrobacterales bacterium]
MLAAMLVPAAVASAAPTGEYARFSKCPTSNPEVEFCLYAETLSGTTTIGNKAVPVKNPVVLQGGLDTNGGGFFAPMTVVGATDGNTLTKAAQPVPGGLLGVTAPAWWPKFLRDLFNETINNGFTGVTATLELAGPPSAVKFSALAAFTGKGTAIGMPVKVKLGNPFLGSNCYIGSNSNPIQLNLTTGTTAPPPPNTPISGNPGIPGATEEGNLLSIKGNKLVDNSFAAPGVNGCGGLFSFLIDPFVDSIVGTPSAAGRNTAILEGNTYIGYAPAVKASE